MIAVESFKRYRIIDIAAIAVISVVFLAIDYLLSLMGPLYYPLVILVLSALMSLVVYLVRKAGAVTLFYMAAAVFTSGIDDIGPLGFRKLIVFVLAGLFFELMYLLLKFEFKNVPVDVVLSVGLSSALIPVITSFIISPDMVLTFPEMLINLVLLSFIAGFIGAILAFFAWHYLRTMKAVLRFEYEQ